MDLLISLAKHIPEKQSLILLCQSMDDLSSFSLSEEERKYIQNSFDKDMKSVSVNRYNRFVFVQKTDEKLEGNRLAAKSLHSSICQEKIEHITVVDLSNQPKVTWAFAEGLALSNYQFLKYFSDKKENSLKEISLHSANGEEEISQLKAVIKGTYVAKDLVNEPFSYLTAMQYSQDIEKLGEEAGFKVEVLHKKKIEALKMGGLLAVNKGSIDPPTFSIMEWKPKTYSNSKPIVLVGKGIVYDTGGLSLKPTANSMDMMKCDMGGSAAVVGTMYAIAQAKLNVHVIGLVPATDNRPSGNAYAPGDVITMHDGTTVEVLNTDAEGRLILADALSFAKNYKPELVIDLATLTGAAARAIGKRGIVAMGNDESTMQKLKESGKNVHERIAEMPFWDDYKEDLKSPIADLKNLGGAEAGAITAGKFLEHFTDYPYTHLDIAGPAFLLAPYTYHDKGGTGVGVRLLFDFLKTKAE
ncbi:MAG: leucyl aminopeptidase [Flavobacteriales bacterium]|nr:leucyl aminopeptidase [Flavobacteriales bacterium]MBL6872378.1 leucyl aminopeptidase [Flavobacteriales bacterium]